MATIDNIKNSRLKKLKAIRGVGILAYPGTIKRTHAIKEILKEFSGLVKSKEEIILTGRLMSLRQHGGLVFYNIQDGTGIIQAIIKKDGVGPKGFKFFLDNFDIGDFVEIKGELFETKRGEKTLKTNDYKIIAKSLLPLPEKWHGLKDEEERFRKRYLDLIFNQRVKENFILRSKIIKELRNISDFNIFVDVDDNIRKERLMKFYIDYKKCSVDESEKLIKARELEEVPTIKKTMNYADVIYKYEEFDLAENLHL